jgi:hypothetical protein
MQLNWYNMEMVIKMKICSECNQMIPAARTKAVPSTTLCRDCQEKKEQNAPIPYKSVAYFTPAKAMVYLSGKMGATGIGNTDGLVKAGERDA